MAGIFDLLIKQGIKDLSRGIESSQAQFGRGVRKGAASTITESSELFAKGLELVTSPITGLKSFGGVESKSAKEMIKEETGFDINKRTPIEEVGFVTEQIAEYFLPSAFASQATAAATAPLKVAENAPLIARVGSAVARTGVKASIDATASGVIALAQSGDFEEASDMWKRSFVTSAVLSAGVGAAKQLNKFLQERASVRTVNSLLKTKAKDFQFGKEPHNAVLEERITANTKGGLIKEFQARKIDLWNEGQVFLNQADEAGKTVNAQKVIDLLDDKIDDAARSGEQALYDRLMKVRSGLTADHFDKIDGQLIPKGTRDLTKLSPTAAQVMKQEIGDATAWTGQAFDADVNQARVGMYRVLDDSIDQVAPAMESINRRYANLLTAEKALQKTIDTQMGQNILGLRQSILQSAIIAGLVGGSAGFAAQDLKTGLIAGAVTTASGLTGVKTRGAIGMQDFGNFFEKTAQLASQNVVPITGLLKNLGDLFDAIGVDKSKSLEELSEEFDVGTTSQGPRFANSSGMVMPGGGGGPNLNDLAEQYRIK